jgi:hypothetical protein
MTGSDSAMQARHSFDDSNISWYSPEAFAGSSIYVLDVDPLRKTYEFLLKLPPRDKIALHRHLTDTKTFVVEGEHFIYEPDGSFREQRVTGSYTSTNGGGPPHREGAGETGGVVFFSVRGEGDLFELMDDDGAVIGVLTADDIVEIQRVQNQG